MWDFDFGFDLYVELRFGICASVFVCLSILIWYLIFIFGMCFYVGLILFLIRMSVCDSVWNRVLVQISMWDCELD